MTEAEERDFHDSHNPTGQMRLSGMPKGVRHYDELRKRWEDMARSERRKNPHDMEAARRTQGAQGALYEQMGAFQAGPSAVDLQGRGALGRNAMSAAAAMGQGGALGSRGVVGQQGGIGADLAARVAQARLAEQMGMSQGRFGVGSNMRGGAIKTADDQSRFGLGIRELDNNRAITGVKGANALLGADIQSKADYDAAFAKLEQQHGEERMNAVKGVLESMMSMFSFGAL